MKADHDDRARILHAIAGLRPDVLPVAPLIDDASLRLQILRREGHRRRRLDVLQAALRRETGKLACGNHCHATDEPDQLHPVSGELHLLNHPLQEQKQENKR